MIDLSDLNNEQREAVLDFDHNLLILACAGSGKTRTITSKIAYAVSEGIFQPYQILAVTFTNRAAGEMRERVSSLLPDMDLSGLEMRTFHSFGAYILRRYAERAGLSPSFCIYDDSDSVSLLASVVDMEKRSLRQIQGAISKAKDRGLSPDSPGLDKYLPDTGYDFPSVFRRYEEALSLSGNADFADLIVKSTNLLKENDDIAEYFHRRFRMILVDEYQDSNRMQYEMLKALAGSDTRVVVVGDDDQSIYSFRGAEIGNILSFGRLFENVREIKLEKNYRSTSEILSVAGALIKHNTMRHSKELISSENLSGPRPSVIYSLTGKGEGERIASLIKGFGDYDSTAILYRTNAQSQVFEQQLTDLRIPYKVIGALRFYEREEVKDGLALLYLLMNHRDQVSFRRIINKPSRGIGNAKIEKIMSMDTDLIQALRAYQEIAPKSAAEGVKLFLSAVESASLSLDTDTNLGDILNKALEDTGLYDLYNSEPDRSVRKTKMENLGQLITVLNEAGYGREALSSFLEKLTLDSTMLGDHDPAEQHGVTLMTMHNTKGLEFERVFVTGLEDSLIPGRSTEDERDVEEERRILYVAMTRAKENLYLSFASQRSMWGHVEYQKPSRFLAEIPLELLGGEKAMVSQRPAKEERAQIHYHPRTSGIVSRPSWAKNIDIGSKKREERPELHLNPGDSVKNPTYGVGTVEDVYEIVPGKRVVTVRFGKKYAKFVEKFADLEKL